ncbi:MAG: hypothetical protein UY85_C0015G0001 [Candidatus Peribacteria bacterium GW2011_GWB1_54_5]|nr:MAG: hypothetical protein UY85_C0015G0001 [Candidatus Peribacteria bacterium GW2011_GWB1_54_5]
MVRPHAGTVVVLEGTLEEIMRAEALLEDETAEAPTNLGGSFRSSKIVRRRVVLKETFD